MKALLFPLFLCLFGGCFHLHAQTATNAPASSHPQVAREMGMISFLTPAQQIQYATARAKALADNPGLKGEGETLMQQARSVMAGGTMADKQAFIEKMTLHRQKLRQAMLKEDATLEPIFSEIDKHISEMKAKELIQAEGSPGATNAVPGALSGH